MKILSLLRVLKATVRARCVVRWAKRSPTNRARLRRTFNGALHFESAKVFTLVVLTPPRRGPHTSLSLSLSTRRGARCTSRTALRGVRRGTLDTACGSPSTEAGTSSGTGDRTVSPLSSDQYSRAAPVLLVVSFLWTIATLHHPSSSSHRSTPCKSRTCSRRYRRPQQQHRRRLLPPPRSGC